MAGARRRCRPSLPDRCGGSNAELSSYADASQLAHDQAARILPRHSLERWRSKGDPILPWVGTHRVHHKYSDRRGDPHTTRSGIDVGPHPTWLLRRDPTSPTSRRAAPHVSGPLRAAVLCGARKTARSAADRTRNRATSRSADGRFSYGARSPDSSHTYHTTWPGQQRVAFRRLPHVPARPIVRPTLGG